MKKSYFIRKNTPELRDKLKELGYHICPCALFEDSVWLHTSFLTDEPTVHGIGFVDEEYTGRKTIQEELDFFLYENSKSQNPWIDCGDNEELFLLLSLLPDPNDKNINKVFLINNKWCLCYNHSNELNILEKTYRFMLLENPKIKFTHAVTTQTKKATIEEIIEHFKS